MTAEGPGCEVPVLRLEHATKTFIPGQPALADASLTVHAGEIHGLLGQNGSGKSTLAKILAGYHDPDPGALLWIDGRPVQLPLSPGSFRQIGLSFVHQELGLVDDLTIVDNFRVGRYSRNRFGSVDVKGNIARTEPLLKEFGVHHPPNTLVAELTAAEKAILAIARAVDELGERPRGVLVLDEPTASLGKDEVSRVFGAIRSVAARGVGVILVTHRIDEILSITDRVTVLRDGRVVGECVTDMCDEAQLIELIVGSRIERIYPEGQAPNLREQEIRIENLQYRNLGPLTLAASTGEVVGVTGLLGSGFDDIPPALSADRRQAKGTVTLGSVRIDLANDDIAKRRQRGMAVIPADRKAAGGATELTVQENLSVPRLSDFVRHGFLSYYWENQDALEALAQFMVKPPTPSAKLSELSGGNQQKVILAKWVRTKPKLLVLHEPTQGVDVGAKKDIFLLLRALADQGTTLILVTNEHRDLAHLCDRIHIVRDGKIGQTLAGDGCSEDDILRACYA